MKRNNKIEEIKERLENAAPGPWVGKMSPYGSISIYDDNEESIHFVDAEGEISMGENDFKFVSNSVQDMGYLLERIEKLEDLIKQAQEHIENKEIKECLDLVSKYKGGE